MKVVFVRHTSVEVPAGMAYGRSDVPLRASFPLEASVTRACLAAYGLFDAAYTSPSTRCTRLADYCGYREATRDERLMEIDLGDWEMQRFDEIADPRMELWRADAFTTAATRGESLADQYGRVRDFLEEMLGTDHEQVVVFTHGGVIACARIFSGEISVEEALDREIAYGGVFEMDLD